ncbi:helix-turn-helix domain-containing protein [Sphingomonas sanguinis]|uniref:helix-turn-helix domain-containing protein n=1 Tax=Sphingomonas sanguinis TaxID=33051 RepID=UPI001C56A7CF|nr:helix-turn-helix transcriptional regulator [Sphingomonas sanguinis]QXT34313.1 helix-turn-helix domain-containing protein [Sphingomonas sanguinis]
MEALQLSQAELARRVGLAQPTIYSLIHRNKVGSKHLHKIARVLLTTAEYLSGETDDPDANAPPPPPPQPHLVTMQVVLPPVEALEQMFAGMLDAIDDLASRDALALQLAQLLPRALSRLKDLRLDWGVPPVQIEASPEFDAAPPSADPVHQQ